MTHKEWQKVYDAIKALRLAGKEGRYDPIEVTINSVTRKVIPFTDQTALYDGAHDALCKRRGRGVMFDMVIWKDAGPNPRVMGDGPGPSFIPRKHVYGIARKHVYGIVVE